MGLVSSFVLSMVITVYVPMAGGINGSGVVTRSGAVPQTGMAACGWQFPFGTVFEITDEDMSQYGLPQVVVCEDRGGISGYYHLDIALVSPDVYGDLNKAYDWGRRVHQVRVFASMEEYRQNEEAEARFNTAQEQLMR